MRRLPIIAAGLAAFLLVVVLTLADFSRDDARVQQAFVAGAFLALGWILTFTFGELGKEIARRQRSVDVQEAFRAEIFDYSEALQDDDSERNAAALRRKVESGGDGKSRYHPLIPRISPPVVFQSMAADISLLPEDAIDRVVQFYSMLSDITVFAEDLMSEPFVNAGAKSRAQALFDYYDMRATTHGIAREALFILGNLKADRRRLRLWVVHALGVAPLHGTAK